MEKLKYKISDPKNKRALNDIDRVVIALNATVMKVNELVEAYNEEKEGENHRIIFVTGAQGSGKTVFINTKLREMEPSLVNCPTFSQDLSFFYKVTDAIIESNEEDLFEFLKNKPATIRAPYEHTRIAMYPRLIVAEIQGTEQVNQEAFEYLGFEVEEYKMEEGGWNKD